MEVYNKNYLFVGKNITKSGVNNKPLCLLGGNFQQIGLLFSLYVLLDNLTQFNNLSVSLKPLISSCYRLSKQKQNWPETLRANLFFCLPSFEKVGLIISLSDILSLHTCLLHQSFYLILPGLCSSSDLCRNLPCQMKIWAPNFFFSHSHVL